MSFIINPTGSARTRGSGIPTIRTFKRDTFATCLEDDLNSVFFGPDGQEFAESVVYTHTNGNVETYSIIYDDPTRNVGFQSSAELVVEVPQFMMQTTDLKSPIQKKDRVLLRGKDYFIEDYEDNGVGVTTVFLRNK